MDQINKYILAKRETGANDLSIAAELRAVGWENSLIEKAFAELDNSKIKELVSESRDKSLPFDPNSIFHSTGSGSHDGNSFNMSTVPRVSELIPDQPGQSNFLKYFTVVIVVSVLGLVVFWIWTNK